MNLLTILVLLGSVYGSNCCICNSHFRHPQEQICDSEYVIVVYITSMEHDYSSFGNQIVFDIEHVLKGRNLMRYPVQQTVTKRVHIPIECTPKLLLNQTYVIGGHFDSLNPTEISFDRCNYIKLLSTFQQEELYGITGNYDRGCGCRIKSCSPFCSTHADNECLWNSDVYNDMTHLTCLPMHHNKCAWTKNGEIAYKSYNDYYNPYISIFRTNPFNYNPQTHVTVKTYPNIDKRYPDVISRHYPDGTSRHHHHIITHDIFNSKHQLIHHSAQNIKHEHPLEFDRSRYPNKVYYYDRYGKSDPEFDTNLIQDSSLDYNNFDNENKEFNYI